MNGFKHPTRTLVRLSARDPHSLLLRTSCQRGNGEWITARLQFVSTHSTCRKTTQEVRTLALATKFHKRDVAECDTTCLQRDVVKSAQCLKRKLGRRGLREHQKEAL